MPVDMPDLLAFIRKAKEVGASDDSLVSLLRHRGWPEQKIYSALGEHYEQLTGIAVPERSGRIEAARDAFLYLVSFMTLGVWSISLGGLFFVVIDRALPSISSNIYAGQPAYDASSQIAGVIVGFPLYLLVNWLIMRSLAQKPEQLDSGVRKWLTYIALFITACTLVGDLVTFLAYFLRGDLTLHFTLKVITVLVIAGGVFAYYSRGLRNRPEPIVVERSFAAAAVFAVALGLAYGFGLLGSPSHQRELSADEERLHNLGAIAEVIRNDWLSANPKTTFKLPANVREAAARAAPDYRHNLRTPDRDPLTRIPYGYLPRGSSNYELCAEFASDTNNPKNEPSFWRHPKGHYCFQFGAETPVPGLPPPGSTLLAY